MTRWPSFFSWESSPEPLDYLNISQEDLEFFALFLEGTERLVVRRRGWARAGAACRP